MSIRPPFFGTPDCEAVTEAASTLDRTFFNVNYRRSRYVREALPGEIGPFEAPDDHTLLVFVTQIEPGIRCREFRSAPNTRAKRVLRMHEAKLQRELEALGENSYVVFVPSAIGGAA